MRRKALDIKNDIRLLEKIRYDFDKQLDRLEPGTEKYDDIKESRNEVLEKLYKLMYNGVRDGSIRQK